MNVPGDPRCWREALYGSKKALEIMEGYNPLHLAVLLNDSRELKLEWERAPFSHWHRDPEGRMPSALACELGYPDIIETFYFLAGNLKSFIHRHNFGRTPLRRAADKGHWDLVRLIRQREGPDFVELVADAMIFMGTDHDEPLGLEENLLFLGELEGRGLIDIEGDVDKDGFSLVHNTLRNNPPVSGHLSCYYEGTLDPPRTKQIPFNPPRNWNTPAIPIKINEGDEELTWVDFIELRRNIQAAKLKLTTGAIEDGLLRIPENNHEDWEEGWKNGGRSFFRILQRLPVELQDSICLMSRDLPGIMVKQRHLEFALPSLVRSLKEM